VPGTSQRAVLGPPLQPVGRHDMTCEAGGLLQHGERHDPLVARSIKDSTNLAWNIIVYVSSIIVVIYQIL
jgi:hypothetical protein